ncbi:MAG: DUF72 domain-containing protein [Bryobacteraceae bacterium]
MITSVLCWNAATLCRTSVFLRASEASSIRQNPASKNFLSYYAERLNSTEVNYTFRQLPKQSTLEAWVAATPSHFVFSLKAHMRLTHILKLQNAGEFLELFLKVIDPLRIARRLGPILFQLPPSLKSEPEILSEFVAQLPGDIRFAFEFRHPSWLNDEIYQHP